MVVLMKDSGWLGATPRQPYPRRKVMTAEEYRYARSLEVTTPPQIAYTYAFVRLCRERTTRAAWIVSLAFELLYADRGLVVSGSRSNPDIDELLLRMARGLVRPIYAGLESSSKDVLTILG